MARRSGGSGVFVYRVRARKSAKWCAASWRMCRYAGHGRRERRRRRFEGTAARAAEAAVRRHRGESRMRRTSASRNSSGENAKLNEDLARTNRDLARTTRDRDRWKRRSEHIKKQLDDARRAGRRQAVEMATEKGPRGHVKRDPGCSVSTFNPPSTRAQRRTPTPTAGEPAVPAEPPSTPGRRFRSARRSVFDGAPGPRDVVDGRDARVQAGPQGP